MSDTAAVKIAIQPGPPHSFAPRFMAYCERRGIAWKAVDCYRSDIIGQIADCDALLWHWYHTDARATLFARGLLQAVEVAGKVVFPSGATAWHFDDKVAQKYLLEAIGAPLARAEVFYDAEAALRWIETATFPQVAKLRGGSGSINVRLIHTAAEARRYVRQAFGRGFAPVDRQMLFQERLRVLRRDQNLQAIQGVAKGLARLVVPTELERVRGNERGYVYFQAFIPGASLDTRIVVIGGRAIAIQRGVRPGDFRASGSGDLRYDPAGVDPRCLRIAFEVMRATGAQCLAFDFVEDVDGPKLLEISYGFSAASYDACPGHWDGDLRWHEGRVSAQDFIMDDVVAAIEARRGRTPS